MLTTAQLTAGLWAGRVLSLVVVLALFGVAANMLLAKSSAHAQLAATGFPDSAGAMIGLTAIVCAVIYAIPQTSALGAILITGFLGGAICTHVRLGEMGSPPQVISLVLGMMTWGGLYLRFPEVRDLLPISQ